MHNFGYRIFNIFAIIIKTTHNNLRFPGNHYIQIYWSGYPITATPIIGHAQRAGGKTPPSPRVKYTTVDQTAADQVDGPLRSLAPKVVLLGSGLVKAQVLKEAIFKVDGTRAGPGKLSKAYNCSE